jgi:sugar phosphate permease
MLASFLEAPILAWTDRRKARRHVLVAAGVAGMALSVVLVSFVQGAIGLALASAFYGWMSGIALGTAEAMLVDGESDDSAGRRLARWSLFASLGDVLAPSSLALAGLVALPWRTSFRVAGVALFMVALALLFLPEKERESQAADAKEPVLAALRGALSNRPLFVWLLGAALCTLLDEVLAVLAAIWVSEKFSHAMAAPTLIAFSLGGVVGAALVERALARWSRSAALIVSSSACAIAMAAWLSAETRPLAIACCFLVGTTAAPLHPLAKAEAFATHPSRPGLVNGAAQAFVAIDLVAPILLAWVAERFGVRLALASLAAQPLALLVMGIVARKRRRSRNPPRANRIGFEEPPRVAPPPAPW